MATIVTRSGKGSPLTNTEVDANFTNLNNDKLETSAAYAHPNHSGEVTSTADGATVIADNVVDEANLKVSNSPTNGYFLSAQSGNTGGLTWAAAASGADLYAANESSPSAQPSATGTNAIAIGDSAISSSADGIAIGLGATHTTVHGTSKALAIGANTVADYYGTAIGAGSPSDKTTASGNSALAIGYKAKSTGTLSTAIGKSLASGADSFAAAIANNTSSYGATGGHSLAMGWGAKATSSQSVSLGGFYSQATDNYAVTLGGSQNTASGEYSVAISGSTNVSSGNYSSVLGGQSNTASGSHSVAMGNQAIAAQQSKFAYSAGRFATDGDAQTGTFVLRSDTTDATAEALTTNNSTAAAGNQIVAASDTCITFSGTIVAMQNGAQAYGSWKIEGLLVNDGGTTTLANSAITVIQNASSWGLALSADNTNNALAITVTGEASHNIRWVANVQTAEVTYA